MFSSFQVCSLKAPTSHPWLIVCPFRTNKANGWLLNDLFQLLSLGVSHICVFVWSTALNSWALYFNAKYHQVLCVQQMGPFNGEAGWHFVIGFPECGHIFFFCWSLGLQLYLSHSNYCIFLHTSNLYVQSFNFIGQNHLIFFSHCVRMWKLKKNQIHILSLVFP